MYTMPQVLLVEDEPVTRVMIECRLRAAGYSVTSAPSGEAALALLGQLRFALMITDLYLDGLDGMALMAKARGLDPELELIVLTGGATLATALAGYDHRVVAYLCKPVAPGQLESAVAAALERHRETIARNTVLHSVRAALTQVSEPHGPVYQPTSQAPLSQQVGALSISRARRRVAAGGRELTLSNGTFELLIYLAERSETVVSADTIAREICHYSCVGDEARELVKTRIYRLRSKLSELRCAEQLVCVRGAGYMLTAGN